MVQIYLRYYFDVNFFFVLFLKARDIIFHEIDNFILFFFESEIEILLGIFSNTRED